MRKALFASSLLALTAACSAMPAPQSTYLLRAEFAGDRAAYVEAPLRVAIARVSVASYLDQVGVVVETDEGQVQAARLHRWAEPVHEGLRSLLRSEMSRELGYDVSAGAFDGVDWDYAVEVYVDRLHGTMNGTAVIEAAYQIEARLAGGEVALYRFSRSVALPREGYPGVVEAEADLARQLAEAIARSLESLEQARSAR